MTATDRIDLARRATALREVMDDPACDPRALDRTFRRFTVVNALVSGWRSAFRDLAVPVLRRAERPRVLDLGCGGGDLARSIRRWARGSGLDVEVVGVDPDTRAIRAATRTRTRGVAFRVASSADLVAEGERFDLVVSNHVLHHLDDGERDAFLADTERLVGPGGLAVHSDIRRSPAAYRAYAVGAVLVSPGTFVRVDGLRSIRRSFTVPELARALPEGWAATARSPHRVVATWRAPERSAPDGLTGAGAP